MDKLVYQTTNPVASNSTTACCSGSLEDRDSAYFSATQSLCPQCRRTIQGKILFRDNKVILAKRCPQHGFFEALLSSNMDYWIKSLTFTKPGSQPLAFSTRVDTGCPDDCGLCEDHEQHTCSPIIEISNHCDLKCPICIVWNQNDYNISFGDFKNIVDGLIDKEGSLELALLSGGEPTLHPEFFRLCEYITSKPQIKRVLVSSHGIRLAKDAAFARRFKELGLYLSLQFDSLEDRNYKAIRGANLLKTKLDCLDMCQRYEIPTVFVPTVVKGFNDHEIGPVVDFALSLDFVTSVTIQPAAYTGSGGTGFPQDPLSRLTQYDIHSLLARQSKWLREEDFLPVPCSHPSCYTASYLLKLNDGDFTPLTRFSDIQTYLDLLTNRAVMDPRNKVSELIQDAVYRLWSAQSVTVDSDRIMESLKSLLEQYGSLNENTRKHVQSFSESRVKAIFIHAFMDEYDFELSRIQKCCTHYALPDGRLIPGCAYNNKHRFQDSRLGLKDAAVVERPLVNFIHETD